MEIPKLDTEFPNASPEVQAAVMEVKKTYRIGQLSRTLEALDKLGNTPGLSEPQKKLVNDLSTEMKQVVANANLPAER